MTAMTKTERYNSTVTGCNCPDYKYRQGGSYRANGQRICKHMLALRQERGMNTEPGISRKAQENIRLLFPTPDPLPADWLKFKDTCSQFVQAMREAEWEEGYEATMPGFVISFANRLQQLLKAVA